MKPSIRLLLATAALCAPLAHAVSYVGCSTAARLENLSTRMQVLTGDDVMIAGFVVGGSVSKTVAVVATGPSLASAGINNFLANPTLTLVRSSDNAVVASNDNWGDAANAAAIQASGFAPSHALESAIMMSLAPGAYTAVVSGLGGQTGVGVASVYEVDHFESPFMSFSTRGQVLTGNDAMMARFVVQGTAQQTVVVNVAGPSLSSAGIAHPLADPTLTLVRSSDQAVIATSDNWGESPDAARIQSTGFAPHDSKEPAVVITLAPGAYTAIVRGAGGGTGVGLVNVYAAAPAGVVADFAPGSTWVDLSLPRGEPVAVSMPELSAGFLTELRSIQNTNTQSDLSDEIAISTCPGNFDVAPECKTWGTVWGGGTYLRAYTTPTSVSGICSMTPGVQYYASVRNVKFDRTTPACNTDNCEMRLQLNAAVSPDFTPPAVEDTNIFSNPQAFAKQQYRDFLGREGDASGVSYWANQIAAGTQSRAQTIASFFDSNEFQGTIAPVARLYFAYFLRIPDYGGLQYWVGFSRSGNSLGAISNQFAQSAEFIQRYGSLDNGQFVDLVYQNVLGRAPDPGGRAFWKAQLDGNSMTRGQVMVGFSESAEYRSDSASEVYVTMMYIGMLRRSPDDGGLSYWVTYLDAGNSGLALINGFLGSTEYHSRFP